MKTILIVVAGMADLPDALTLKETPLTVASVPALDMLARRGEITSFASCSDRYEVSHKNALLSLLGYDLEKGEPDIEELMEYGLDHSAPISSFGSLRPFVIPGFSGHGVCLTTSAWVRGVAKCALLKPLDVYSPGSSDTEILEVLAEQSVKALLHNEFVFLYVDTPLRAALRGDYEDKVRALELIDRHLVTPIADFTWKSDLMINLAVTTDLVTPWHTRRPSLIGVPTVLYFNNHDWDGYPERSFTEVESMLTPHTLNHPSDLIRYLCYFNISEEENE